MNVGLVGRDHELALLRGWLREAATGRGRVVLAGGEAGIGKSALMAALADGARELGLRVLVGRTTEAEGAPPNWPWLQILDQLGARALLDAPAGADPESEQFTRLEAVRARLMDEPALIVIDDAHRADRASLRLLVHLAEAVPEAPVVLAVTHRSEPVDRTEAFDTAVEALARVPGGGRIDLVGLDPAGVAQLLPADLPPAVTGAVWERSNGNPLLARELGRHLANGATLVTVPRSVRDGVALRLGRRSPECVELVRFAAVAGRSFPVGLLATVTGRAALAVLNVLDEAVAAALVEPEERPGTFRFVHALVRDAVLATLGTADLATRHRDLARAVEIYEADSDSRTLELARLWEAASALGEEPTAAAWCARAGAVAEEQLAWEDAARLYRRALELGASGLSPIEEHEWALGLARALAHCRELAVAIACCVRAATAARRAGRADLVAQAVLVLEGRGNLGSGLEEAAHAALADLPAEADHLRARVHAQLANMAFYTDPSTMEAHCAEAERAAGRAGDPEPELAALRARNMLSYGPEHAPLRLDLAHRLGRAAQAARRPSVGFWAPLWRIDALVELGRLPEAVATLPDLRQAVRAAGIPIARWHQARAEAALAQATGRFDDAGALAAEARALFARLESPFGADAMYLGFQVGVALHTGFTPEVTDAWAALDLSQAPPYIAELPLLGSAAVALAAGDPDRARQWYQQLPPVAGWATQPAIRLQLLAIRIQVAAGLGEATDLSALYDALLPHRRLHVGSGGGVVNYLGPVELWLGVAAAGLQRHDAAVDHLQLAAAAARAAGADGFAVHAEVALAETLAARDKPGDRAAAGAGATSARSAAVRLGMAPFTRRIGQLLAGGAAALTPLSPRELEVAALVATGRTNREIAGELYISERTAQNHVQHILTKLGLDNRTQIATWHQNRHDPVDHPA